jgi:hypothetical protein
VAQLGSALPWGGRGRGFKSLHTDRRGKVLWSHSRFGSVKPRFDSLYPDCTVVIGRLARHGVAPQNDDYYGAWLSLEEHSDRTREVAGSNPAVPTQHGHDSNADAYRTARLLPYLMSLRVLKWCRGFEYIGSISAVGEPPSM